MTILDTVALLILWLGLTSAVIWCVAEIFDRR